MPGLAAWLAQYGLASALCLAATYMVLRWRESEWLRAAIARDIDIPGLSPGGSMALIGILATALVLLAASALDLRLGVPTLIAGLVTAALVLARGESGAWAILRGVSWGVLPLVAGLFVLVEALGRTGLVAMLAALLHRAVLAGAGPAAWGTGILLAVSCNLVNNLPAGLVAGHVVDMAPVPARVRAAVLIGVDLGPNLSVTGSLATILWLAALRRDGVRVSAWDFLKSGAVVMPAALLLALAGAFFSG
jgi:arsenical pump membrane protein